MPLAVALGEHASREFALTRWLLERLPDEAMTWQPHARSFTLGELATHLARLPHWGAQILMQPSYDVTSGASRRPAESTRSSVLALFDRHTEEFGRTLHARSDRDLTARWTLTRGSVVLEAVSHLDAVERYMLHHLIHHRGQLTVYLRLLDVPLVPLYGPTADTPQL